MLIQGYYKGRNNLPLLWSRNLHEAVVSYSSERETGRGEGGGEERRGEERRGEERRGEERRGESESPL